MKDILAGLGLIWSAVFLAGVVWMWWEVRHAEDAP